MRTIVIRLLVLMRCISTFMDHDHHRSVVHDQRYPRNADRRTPQKRPWYITKTDPSTTAMLYARRDTLTRNRIKPATPSHANPEQAGQPRTGRLITQKVRTEQRP